MLKTFYTRLSKLFSDRLLATRTGQPPKWNFHKYLIDKTGQQITAFESAVAPEDRRLTSQIEKLLAAR